MLSTDRRTDGRTDKVNPVYPPRTSLGRGYNYSGEFREERQTTEGRLLPVCGSHMAGFSSKHMGRVGGSECNMHIAHVYTSVEYFANKGLCYNKTQWFRFSFKTLHIKSEMHEPYNTYTENSLAAVPYTIICCATQNTFQHTPHLVHAVVTPVLGP